MGIEITKSLWSTSFTDSSQLNFPVKWGECEVCGSLLNTIYTYIIDCLEEADLLPENFKRLCCMCYLIKEYFGGNYHRGCTFYLIAIPQYPDYTCEYGLNIICQDCGVPIGEIFERPLGVMNVVKHRRDICDLDET